MQIFCSFLLTITCPPQYFSSSSFPNSWLFSSGFQNQSELSVYHLSSHFHAALFSRLETTLSLWIPQPFSHPPVPVLSVTLQVQALEWQTALISEILPDWFSHWKVVLGCAQGCLDSVPAKCPLHMWLTGCFFFFFFIYWLGFAQNAKVGHLWDDFL